MNKQKITNKRYLTGWMLTGVLLALLLIAVPVFADGEVPAEAPPAETTELEQAPPAEAPPTEEIVPVEEATVEPPAETLPVDLEPVGEIPAPAPETKVVMVADAVSEPLEPVCQDSAEELLEGDPWWMVGTTKYSVLLTGQTCPFGTSGVTCWTSSNPINYALYIIDLYNYLPTNRKINVEAGTYPGFTLDGSDSYTDWQIGGIIGAGSGASIINGDVNILNNGGGFTLSGFTVNGGVNILEGMGNLLLQDLDISHSGGKGLDIHNTWYSSDPYEEIEGPRYSGTITLDGVNSHDNGGEAAIIRGMNTVKVSNSSFNNNNIGMADAVDTVIINLWGGKVELNGVIASGNFGGGIAIDAPSVAIRNVITNDNYIGSYVPDLGYYFGYGLVVNTWSGTMLLENVTANNNHDTGIYVYYYGTGTVTLKNIEADNNWYEGISLYAGSGSASLTNISVSGNGSDGVNVSAKKAITINSIFSSNNDGNGVGISGVSLGFYDSNIDEWVWTGVSNPKVTISNKAFPSAPNFISNNSGQGLYINTNGAVSISNVNIDSNGLDGIWVSNVYYDNSIDDWVYDGCGAVTIKSTIPGVRNWINNNGSGIYIDSVKGNILIEKTNVENSQNASGIEVFAMGAIMLKEVSSINNNLDGAWLDNSAAIGKSITVQDTSKVPNSWFNENGGDGLFIRSSGSITLNGVNANDNTASGANLDNCLEVGGLCTGTGSITIKHPAPWWADFNGNDEFGIRALSKGTITLQNVSGSYNGLGGAWLWNYYTGSTGSVKVAVAGSGVDNSFNGNGWRTDYTGSYDYGNDGLYVRTNGTISVNNVQAHDNQHNGAGIFLMNYQGPAVRTIFMQNIGANGNDNSGLYAYSKGSITLKQFEFRDNGADGAILDNTYGATSKVTILSAAGSENAVSGNIGTGLSIYTNGAAVFSNLRAEGNLNGVMITAASVSGKGNNNLNFNTGAGLLATTTGNISLTGNMLAIYNGTNGLELNNSGGSGNVTISGISIADFNGQQGVSITTAGTVSISNLEVMDNGTDGLFVDGYGILKTVTLKNVTALYNGEDGIYVDAKGKLTLSGVRSWFNTWDGVYLRSWDNPVIITASSFMNNDLVGVRVNHGTGLFTIKTSIYIGNLNGNLVEY